MAGQVVWYSHLFQNFPQFIVIYTVKGFGIVNKAEIDVFRRKLANLITRTTVLSNSMKLSHAVWGHLRRTGPGGEV